MRRNIGLMGVALCTLLFAAFLPGPAGHAEVPGRPAEIAVQRAPGIMFSTLLNNVAVNAKGGWLKLENQMQNVFMPAGATGKVVLMKGASEFCHWEWGLDEFGLQPPYKLFAFRSARRPNGEQFPVGDLKLTAPGAYSLDFYAGGAKFYTFPFTLTTLEPADPFDGETMYFTEGPWNDWGYLHYKDADPEMNLYWKIWLREKSFKNPEHKVSIRIVRDADKKVICQNRDDYTFRFQHDWVRYDFDMVNPPVKTSSGDYFKAKDLVSTDGAYTLTMTLDGKPYGTWKFNVVGGKPAPAGRTERGKADPLTFIEGGKDAFWYERVK